MPGGLLSTYHIHQRTEQQKPLVSVERGVRHGFNILSWAKGMGALEVGITAQNREVRVPANKQGAKLSTTKTALCSVLR